MGIASKLVGFVVRQAVGRLIGRSAVQVAEAVADHFTAHSLTLPRALVSANERAWNALTSALSDGIFDKVKGTLDSGDDQLMREQIRTLLQDEPRDFRKKCLAELKLARQAGCLSLGDLRANDVAQDAARFPFCNNLQRAQEGAVELAEEIGDGFAEFPNLSRLVRKHGNGQPPLLVEAFIFYFRLEVQTDAGLFRRMAFDILSQLSAAQERVLRALDEHSKKLALIEDGVNDIQARTVDIRSDTLEIIASLDDQGQGIARLTAVVIHALRLAHPHVFNGRPKQPIEGQATETISPPRDNGSTSPVVATGSVRAPAGDGREAADAERRLTFSPLTASEVPPETEFTPPFWHEQYPQLLANEIRAFAKLVTASKTSYSEDSALVTLTGRLRNGTADLEYLSVVYPPTFPQRAPYVYLCSSNGVVSAWVIRSGWQATYRTAYVLDQVLSKLCDWTIEAQRRLSIDRVRVEAIPTEAPAGLGRAWWEADPQRLQAELTALQRVAGVERIEVLKSEGLAQLTAWGSAFLGKDCREGVIVFPAAYPVEPPYFVLVRSDGQKECWRASSGWQSQYTAAEVIQAIANGR